MYHRGREKMRHLIIVAVFILNYPKHTLHKSIATPRPETNTLSDDNLDNTIIDFEEDYTVRFNKKYGIPLDADNYFNKDSHRYTLIKDYDKELDIKGKNKSKILDDENTTVDYSVIPLELISTTENILHVTKNIEESENLKVIPLTTEKLLIFDIKQIVLSPSTTESERNTEFVTENIETTTEVPEDIAQSELNETKKRGDREILVTTEKIEQKILIIDKSKQNIKVLAEVTESTIQSELDETKKKYDTEILATTGKIRPKIAITEKNKENIKLSTKDSFKDSKELKQTTIEEAVSVIDINNENQTNNLLTNTSTEYVDTMKTISKLNYDKDSNKVTTIVINTNDDSQTSTPSTNITKTHKNSSNLNFNGDPNRIDKKITRRNEINVTHSNLSLNIGSINKIQPNLNASDDNNNKTTLSLTVENKNRNKNKTSVNITLETINRSDSSSTEEIDVPIFTELDTEDLPDVPEDYYDTKDVVPTTAPKTDALSVIFGLAGSVVESVVGSVAERVVPKSIYDLFKRMQRQNEALEAERLRSREENGGLGHFGRGILKSISTGISKPLSQLMAGVRDIGSLDSDRGFVNSLASGVTSVANAATSLVDAFKDRVQAIYPGTVWCGDGRSATARSSDLGLFFFTDTCCRQHDACKLYIRSGETKYGLTNTGIFTRSHCSCDAKFRECLQRTNSLVSAQIGLTYFNVLGPQCFRRAHPIVKCVRRTRITGQRCEEYELDYTKPRMWQWFDNETY